MLNFVLMPIAFCRGEALTTVFIRISAQLRISAHLE